MTTPEEYQRALGQAGPLEAPLLRRSQYLAQLLQQGQQGAQAPRSGKELGVRLLAQALGQYAQRRNDSALNDARLEDIRGDPRNQLNLPQDTAGVFGGLNGANSLVAALGGGQEATGTPTRSTAGDPTPPPPPPPQASNMDPQTNDMLARLLIGEAPPEGRQAVANVVLNRARSSGMRPQDVITAPHQFEPYGNRQTWQRLQGIDPQSPDYQNAVQAIQSAQQQDVTHGATHFYSPQTQAAMGRQPPAWAQGQQGTNIGGNSFFNLPYSAPPGYQAPPSQPAPPVAAGAPPAAQPPPVAPAGGMPPQQPGNIDLNNRPVTPNGNGYSTVLSMSFGTPQGEILVPRVSDDGRILSNDEAMAEYRRTGRHLGIFRSPAEANAYAQTLHNQQAQQYGGQASARGMNGGQPPQIRQAPPPPGSGQGIRAVASPQEIQYLQGEMQSGNVQRMRAAAQRIQQINQQAMAQPEYHYNFDASSGQGVYAPNNPNIGPPQTVRAQGFTPNPTMISQNGVQVAVDPRNPAAGGQAVPIAPQAMNHPGNPQQNADLTPGTATDINPFGARNILQSPPPGFQGPGGAGGPVAQGPNDPRNPANRLQGLESARREIAPLMTAATGVRRNMNAVQAGLAQNNGSGDITAVNGLQRLIDEGVVHSEDISLQMRANGLPGSFGTFMQYVTGGGQLTPEQRTALGRTAQAIFQSQDQLYQSQILSRRQGIDAAFGPGAFDEVVPPAVRQQYGWESGQQQAQQPGAQRPPQGQQQRRRGRIVGVE